MALALALTIAVGTARPAAAEDVVVAGAFSGAGETTYDEPCRPLARNVIDGEEEWTGLGPSTIHLDFCIDLFASGDRWPVTSGTFEIGTSDGTLSGDVSGYVAYAENSPEGLPVHLGLRVTHGTGTLARADGTLTVDAVYLPRALFVIEVVATVSGSISIPPPTPTEPADCRHGGWRHLADGEGQPFRNQGQCIAWARHRSTPSVVLSRGSTP